MNIELIVCILLGILLAFSTWMAGEYWKEKEHYRCRVFELTNGKEGSNLVVVIPDTPPPLPPKKPNIEDIEDENVNKVIEQFDFDKARSIMLLTARNIDHVPTIDELKKSAKRLLLMCMEHQDREFWWAGGMHHGGICATYDKKWGLSLIYIEGVSRVKIQKE